jgi:dihydrofolate reductase
MNFFTLKYKGKSAEIPYFIYTKTIMSNHHVFIATSLDGYIADAQGAVHFLDTYPMPGNSDMGYYAFMDRVDALLMGRKSFETVLGFGVAWPYTKPVFVWSQKLQEIPAELAEKAFLVRGNLYEVEEQIKAKGYTQLYLDGGQVIQSFLQADKVSSMTITTIPVLLGNGVRLFGELENPLAFQCVSSTCYENGMAQQVFERKPEIQVKMS